QAEAAVGVIDIARLIDEFRRQMRGALDVAFRRVLRGKLAAHELGGAYAIWRIDVALERNHARRLEALAADAPIDKVAVAAIEADDMRTLVMLEEVRDARRRFLRVLARQDFQIGVLEHHAAVAGTQRLDRLAGLPRTGMRRKRR